jgi:putative acetyltransferase
MGNESMKIIEADYKSLAKVTDLFREYQQFIGVDLCFQGFEEELAGLPSKYAPPAGAIFIAIDNGELIGCVAIRPIDQQQAELKRLYVKPDWHGQGVGKQLFECAMARAQSIGYGSIVLDTLESMRSARKLYLGYGFREIESYYHNPDPTTKFYRYDFG